MVFSNAGSLQAQSVHGSCVGSINPDGSVNKGDCGASSVPNAPSGGGGYNAVQQMQLQGAHDVGAAIGTAFVNWLLAPPSHNAAQRQQQERQQQWLEQQRQQEMQRQLAEQERLRREAAERFRRNRDELLGNLKGGGSDQELKLKDLDRPVFSPLQKKTGTIDCAMVEIYEAAAALGPQGREFGKDLLRDVRRRVEGGLSKPAPPGEDETFDIVAVTHDSQEAGARADSQMVVDVLVSGNRKTGDVYFHTEYHLSKSGAATTEGQSTVIFDSAGNVNCQEVSSAMARCAAQLNPAAAAAEYCPKPPPAPPAKEAGPKKMNRWFGWMRRGRNDGASSGKILEQRTPAAAPAPAPVKDGATADGLPLK